MRWLRLAWLWLIGFSLVLGGGSTLAMRLELWDPAPSLGPDLFGHSLALHGLMALGVLVAALLAIPTLVVKPGRGAVVLGFLALGLWVAAMAALVGGDLLGPQDWPGPWPRHLLLVLAASMVLGAAQLAVSLPANADRASRPQLVAAAGGIAAIAVFAAPLLFAREVPTATSWLLATTIVACSVIPDAMKRVGPAFTLLASVPWLVLAWAATAFVRAMSRGTDADLYLHDTLVELAPLPVTGGALLGALVLAATRLRAPQRMLVMVAAALITAGAGLTSIGFLVLGARGMPRRYLAYLPELQPLQILVGVAAAIAVLGGLVAVEAFRRGAPADG